ncbi:hypothetical protein CDAR_167811 [Caerostris darwini]|uniref:Uncharacterized protein n=1 Tax=Caerostris darwini TaxID=1538125 RepID=A0AAV4N094_9ARAC|nr:hypothetical protein CDAR_167811 [Caerostris darwini]
MVSDDFLFTRGWGEGGGLKVLAILTRNVLMSRGIQLDCFSFKLLVGPSIEAAPSNVRRDAFSVPKANSADPLSSERVRKSNGKRARSRFLFREKFREHFPRGTVRVLCPRFARAL